MTIEVAPKPSKSDPGAGRGQGAAGTVLAGAVVAVPAVVAAAGAAVEAVEDGSAGSSAVGVDVELVLSTDRVLVVLALVATDAPPLPSPEATTKATRPAAASTATPTTARREP
jgi:hypothetical protein